MTMLWIYINTFLKLKQESSGYPQNVKSEEEKQAYIDQYLDHEGIPPGERMH